jgi:hypothetical protein
MQVSGPLQPRPWRDRGEPRERAGDVMPDLARLLVETRAAIVVVVAVAAAAASLTPQAPRERYLAIVPDGEPADSDSLDRKHSMAAPLGQESAGERA